MAPSSVLNFSGSAVMHRRLVGSRRCFRRSRPPRLIVSLVLLPCRPPYLTPLCLLANFLRINIYLTQKISEDMLWNIAVNDAGAEYDPLTLLRTRTMFGRPDWKSIYGRMSQAIQSGQYLPGTNSQLKTRVGVSDLSLCTNIRPKFELSPSRHTSAVLVFLPRRSRRPARRTTTPPFSSTSRR